MAKKAATVHICSECIKEFASKDIYSALKPDALLPHYTVYCKKCIDDLGIKEYTPYLKSRVSKSNDTESDKPKKSKTTAANKSKTTAKTKNATVTKTKNTTRKTTKK